MDATGSHSTLGASDSTRSQDESRFRELFEGANEGIWILDASGLVQMANPRLAEMLGGSRLDVIGRRMADFVFEEDWAYVESLFAERRAGYAAAVDVRFRRRDGKAIWVLMSSRPRFEAGAFAGSIDMFTDITLRREAEEKFRVFFELSAAGHALVDPATKRYLHVNRRWCEMLGRSCEELLQLTFTDVTHPEDRAADKQRFDDLYAGRIGEVITEKRYVRPDGSVFWGQLTSSVVRNRDGVPELQLGVVQDITPRKIVEAELTESRTRLRLATEAADLGVFSHDTRTGQDRWNDQARRLLGLPPDAPESAEVFLRSIHPDDLERVKAELRSVLTASTSHEYQIELRVVWPDASVHILAVNGIGQPYTDVFGNPQYHIVGAARDVTAAREFEQELRNKVAERTRDLEEKTRQLEAFVYTVAHDLRAPLRSINGYADLVLEEYGPTAEGRVYLERIKDATRRLDSLIRDLLVYSRVTQVAVNLESVEIGPVMEAVLRDLQPDILRTGAKVTVSPELPAVMAERSIVEHVLGNLISNAVKFTAPGVPPEIDVAARTKDGWVRIEVRDNGIGIPPEYHEKIFNVFERLQSSRAYPGTGVGLAIVARGVQRVGGRFGVRSSPGTGSIFWVEFRPGA